MSTIINNPEKLNNQIQFEVAARFINSLIEQISFAEKDNLKIKQILLSKDQINLMKEYADIKYFVYIKEYQDTDTKHLTVPTFMGYKLISREETLIIE